MELQALNVSLQVKAQDYGWVRPEASIDPMQAALEAKKIRMLTRKRSQQTVKKGEVK